MNKSIKILGMFVIGIMIIVTSYLLVPKAQAEELNRFEAIPEMPNDFYAYTREVWSGGLTDLCSLEEGYWKQPEFYGDSWEIAKEKFYDNPDYSKWGVYGQGNIPSEISYTIEGLDKGESIEFCTFFHNGWGVWTYQGFKLLPIESEYFDIEITPDELTLSPTFPVFEDGWTKKITIKVTAKEDVPVGEYHLGFNVVAPSEIYSRDETTRVLKMVVNKEDYLTECIKQLGKEDICNDLINMREKKYVEGGSYQTNQETFKLILNII